MLNIIVNLVLCPSFRSPNRSCSEQNNVREQFVLKDVAQKLVGIVVQMDLTVPPMLTTVHTE